MNNAEEATKIAKDTRFAVLGRQIADATNSGQRILPIVEQLAILRQNEQDSADRNTQFAALARQIGDAHRNRKDIVPLVQRLRYLRSHELCGGNPPRS